MSDDTKFRYDEEFKISDLILNYVDNEGCLYMEADSTNSLLRIVRKMEQAINETAEKARRLHQELKAREGK